MKKVVIKSIIDYGRTYEENANQEFFLCLLDCSIHERNELIERYGFTDSIMSDGYALRNDYNYIALFQVNVIDKMKDFLLESNDKELFKKINKLNADQLYVFFQKYVEVQPYVHQSWLEYQDNCLSDAAVRWCRDNDIAYSLK